MKNVKQENFSLTLSCEQTSDLDRQVIREIGFCIKNDKFYIASVLTEQLAEVMPVINKIYQ